jgi:S-DNA-T family DNA segregation ATPase FtsK/SpoIIIE
LPRKRKRGKGTDPEPNLPAIPGNEIEPEIIDGEIVDEQPGRVITPARAVRVVVVVIRHPAVKHAGRHAGYIPLGAWTAGKRLVDSRTTARYDRWIRLAESQGDHETAKMWDDQRMRFLNDRHRRRMERRDRALATVKASPWIAGGSVSVLFVTGVFLAIADKRLGEIAVPFEVIAHIVMWIAIAAAITWGPFLWAAPEIALLVLWYVGRAAAGSPDAPAWARTAMDPDSDIVIDETTIAEALKALKIAQIGDYLKQGGALQYLVPCRVDGRGTYAQIRLPKGVTAEKVARRRADLATGLYRSATEVWPSTGGEAGIMDLWIADKGALAEGAGPYPLAGDGFTSVFRGLPFGRSLRGEPVKVPVIGRNTICGGMPEQGKSSAARIVAAGYTLDIATELRIFVPDTNFDFEVFGPRCARYVMGAEDEHIEAIRYELEDLKDELQARGQLLVDCGQPEVTERVAATVPGLHPLFWLLEEAHVAIQHKKHGKDIGQLLGEVVKLDRKRGVHLFVSTQAPTKDSMPRDVTRNCANGIAFAVGDHVANDALLGQGAYRAGHRATELIPGTDRGTALCKGFSGQRSEMVQVHFLSVRSDNDQVTPLVRRALTAMADQGRPLPGTERGPTPITVRDLLADVDQVLGADRVKLRDLLGMLRTLAPSWAPYKTMTATALREALEDEGVKTVNLSGTVYADPAEVRSTIARRDVTEVM